MPAGVKVPMGGPDKDVGTGCALGPAVGAGDGVSGELLGAQAAASNPAAKVLSARRKLRRERGFIMGERPTG